MIPAKAESVDLGSFIQKILKFESSVADVFVLVGGICHFLAVIWHVLPVRPEIAIAG